MHTANQLARAARESTYRPPRPSDPPPPAYLTVPVDIARKAIAIYHQQGRVAAHHCISTSILTKWAGHANPSMATGAQNVIAGLEAYMDADKVDGRQAVGVGREAVLDWPGVQLSVRFDVVLRDGLGYAGRVVLWDEPDLSQDQAELIAAPFREALAELHPGAQITGIGVWQGRRQTHLEVPAEVAERRLKRAQILAERL
jgi:hypothetical protein